jgi:phosphate transport system permease protein
MGSRSANLSSPAFYLEAKIRFIQFYQQKMTILQKTLPNKSQVLLDVAFKLTALFFAFAVFSILAGILITLVIGSIPSFKAFGWGFLTSSAWDPVNVDFGAIVPVFGTLVTSVIAMLIGVPVSFGIALFLTELSPNCLKRPLGVAIELLAGIPSIIYGMWGLFIFAPFMADHIQPWLIDYLGPMPFIGILFQGAPMGIGMLTAGIILGIMIIPFIASVTRDVFDVVPPQLKESAYAVGCTTWEVVWYVVLPYTKIGVVGGVMLGLGRALGETMAVTFVIGNAQNLSMSLLDPGNSIASALANEFNEAVGDVYVSALIELGLIMFVITFIVLALSKLMLMQLARREGDKS